jgi:outer membrane phospholipase A
VRLDLVGFSSPAAGEQTRFRSGQTLSATFRTASASFPVTLEATSDAAEMVEPHGPSARMYSMTIPDAPEGEATLTVTAGDEEIAAAVRVARDGTSEPRERAPTTPTVEAVRTLPGRLSIYQPNYFVYGGSDDEPAVKFQLSLKYRLLTFGEETPDHARPSLQLAYTQRSLWDVRGPSAPFYDTSYMPELFVERGRPPHGRERPMAFLGWATGWRHESNGKDGDASRSLDVVYARAQFAAGSLGAWYFAVTPEIWQYVGPREEDVEKYRGYGKVHLVAGHGSGPSLAWAVTPEHGLGHLTHQLDLSIPVRVRRKVNFASYIVVQYFDGYAESLRDLGHESRSVRVGLSLVR